MSTVAALLAEGTAALAAAGIENPRFEAGLILLGAATGRTRTRLASLPTEAVAASDAAQYRAFVARRAAREPMAYVLGRAEFWSLGFAVGPGVLVPRPDTETLVEVATRAFPDRARALRVLDLGVGSGCLLLSLLHLFPNARGRHRHQPAGARLRAPERRTPRGRSPRRARGDRVGLRASPARSTSS